MLGNNYLFKDIIFIGLFGNWGSILRVWVLNQAPCMLSVPLLNNFPSPRDISVSVPAWTHYKAWIHPKYLKDQYAFNEIMLVIGNTVMLRNSAVGTGEISQWLSAHTEFAEDPSSVPRLCTVACNSSSRGFSSLNSAHMQKPQPKRNKNLVKNCLWETLQFTVKSHLQVCPHSCCGPHL